jgi:dTDP-4-dehydrorhamnose reductase
MMMRILLLGSTGQLGWELERSLAPLGQVEALDYPQIDLTKLDTIVPRLREFQPQLIVNAAAYTAVDKAESEVDLAMAVNAVAPGVLAEEAKKMNATLIHYSTDYVFDGNKSSPYYETDKPNPINVYGKSKLAGERAVEEVHGNHLILRTAWVYSMRRDSFVTKVLQWSRKQKTLKLVTDQVSNPTWARGLAEITALLIARAGNGPAAWINGYAGLYHLAGDGYASRYEWGQEILQLDPMREEQIVEDMLPSNSNDFPTPAQRPLFSALNCDYFVRTFDLHLPDWKPTLKLALSR